MDERTRENIRENIWAMFEGRAAQVGLISLLSTGDARGANSILRVYWICEKNVAATVCASIYMFFESNACIAGSLTGPISARACTRK